MYVSERVAMPCPDHAENECPSRAEVCLYWRASDNTVAEPLLEGVLLGKERDAYVEHLKTYAELFAQMKKEDNEAAAAGGGGGGAGAGGDSDKPAPAAAGTK